MKTRLEIQIEKKELKLNQLKEFAKSRMAAFNQDAPILLQILKRYEVKELDANNSHVMYSPMDGEITSLRIYLPVDFSEITDRRKENLKKALREANIKCPIGGISRTTLEIYYS